MYCPNCGSSDPRPGCAECHPAGGAIIPLPRPPARPEQLQELAEKNRQLREALEAQLAMSMARTLYVVDDPPRLEPYEPPLAGGFAEAYFKAKAQLMRDSLR